VVKDWEVTLSFGDKIHGKELLRLLDEINQTGSLSRAVEEAGISYRYGWGLLNRAEKTLGQALVTRQAGGTAGGGTTLTEEGKKLLRHMERLQQEVQGQLAALLGSRQAEASSHIMFGCTGTGLF
jgi:molybdate transport repressor ModE-like protein